MCFFWNETYIIGSVATQSLDPAPYLQAVFFVTFTQIRKICLQRPMRHLRFYINVKKNLAKPCFHLFLSHKHRRKTMQIRHQNIFSHLPRRASILKPQYVYFFFFFFLMFELFLFVPCFLSPGAHSLWPWASHGTPRNSTVLTATHPWQRTDSWRRGARCTASAATSSSSLPPAPAASRRSWG